MEHTRILALFSVWSNYLRIPDNDFIVDMDNIRFISSCIKCKRLLVQLIKFTVVENCIALEDLQLICNLGCDGEIMNDVFGRADRLWYFGTWSDHRFISAVLNFEDKLGVECVSVYENGCDLDWVALVLFFNLKQIYFAFSFGLYPFDMICNQFKFD